MSPKPTRLDPVLHPVFKSEPKWVSPISLLDLREITRDSDKITTTVTVHLDEYDRDKHVKWIVCGHVKIHALRESSPDGRWLISAHTNRGMTDPEHDSSYAFRLPIIGLQFMHAIWGIANYTGWIHPDNADDFHIPPVGYDPRLLPGAYECNGKRNCRWKDGEKHFVTPHYLPPVDSNLFKVVRGKRVEISIGLTTPEEE